MISDLLNTVMGINTAVTNLNDTTQVATTTAAAVLDAVSACVKQTALFTAALKAKGVAGVASSEAEIESAYTTIQTVYNTDLTRPAPSKTSLATPSPTNKGNQRNMPLPTAKRTKKNDFLHQTVRETADGCMAWLLSLLSDYEPSTNTTETPEVVPEKVKEEGGQKSAENTDGHQKEGEEGKVESKPSDK